METSENGGEGSCLELSGQPISKATATRNRIVHGKQIITLLGRQWGKSGLECRHYDSERALIAVVSNSLMKPARADIL